MKFPLSHLMAYEIIIQETKWQSMCEQRHEITCGRVIISKPGTLIIDYSHNTVKSFQVDHRWDWQMGST